MLWNESLLLLMKTFTGSQQILTAFEHYPFYRIGIFGRWLFKEKIKFHNQI